MVRQFRSGILIAAAVVALSGTGAAETIDRVLAVVAGQVILLSDVTAARDLGLQSADGAADPVRAVLVASHGPFTWGKDAFEAVEHARVLEYVARMEASVRLLAPDAARPAAFLVDRHFLRKHGRAAYYGQR